MHDWASKNHLRKEESTSLAGWLTTLGVMAVWAFIIVLAMLGN